MVGKSLDNLVGLANCFEGETRPSILKSSHFCKFGKENHSYRLWDIKKDTKATDKEIVRAPGYSLYKGKGKTLLVGFITTFL